MFQPILLVSKEGSIVILILIPLYFRCFIFGPGFYNLCICFPTVWIYLVVLLFGGFCLVCFGIYSAWCFLSFLNLWLVVQLLQIFLLSFFSFWHSYSIHIIPFGIVPQFLDVLFYSCIYLFEFQFAMFLLTYFPAHWFFLQPYESCCLGHQKHFFIWLCF